MLREWLTGDAEAQVEPAELAEAAIEPDVIAIEDELPLDAHVPALSKQS
jgi:hypothetical protein